MGLGGAGVALPADQWMGANPASLAQMEGFGAGLFAGQAFELSEFRLGAVYALHGFSWGTVRAGAQSFGFDAFREHQFPLSLARSFEFGTTRAVSVGAEARYYHVRMDGFGSDASVGLSLGMQVYFSPELQFGVSTTNLNEPALGDEDELPRSLQAGVAYLPRGPVTLLLDVVKDVRFPVSYRGGVEVAPVDALRLRGGLATEPTRFTVGVGLHLGRIVADVATDRHEVLGWSPVVGVSFR